MAKAKAKQNLKKRAKQEKDAKKQTRLKARQQPAKPKAA